MTWIDTIVVVIVVVVALVILYKALKEPLDLLWAGIKKAFGWAGQEISNLGGSIGSGRTVIKYGE